MTKATIGAKQPTAEAATAAPVTNVAVILMRPSLRPRLRPNLCDAIANPRHLKAELAGQPPWFAVPVTNNHPEPLERKPRSR